MAKRAALRKAVKWGGLAVCVLLAVAWVGSCRYAVWWRTPGSGFLTVQAGRLGLQEPLWPLGLRADGEFYFRPEYSDMYLWPASGQLKRGGYAAWPLWIPLLITTGATAAAWWPDVRALRRRRAGACPACGYDRRGLQVGKVCPECGAASCGESMAKPDA